MKLAKFITAALTILLVACGSQSGKRVVKTNFVSTRYTLSEFGQLPNGRTDEGDSGKAIIIERPFGSYTQMVYVPKFGGDTISYLTISREKQSLGFKIIPDSLILGVISDSETPDITFYYKGLPLKYPEYESYQKLRIEN